MATKIITEGNRAVVITSRYDAGPFRCRVWVNVRGGMAGADPTPVACKRITMKGAELWAAKQLGEAA